MGTQDAAVRGKRPVTTDRRGPPPQPWYLQYRCIENLLVPSRGRRYTTRGGKYMNLRFCSVRPHTLPRALALTGMAALCLVGLLPVPAGAASFTSNGLGFGTVSASVWCPPAAPPGAPTATATATGFGVSVAVGPGVCAPPAGATSASASNGVFWQGAAAAAAAGGGSSGGPEELVPLVTPTSPSAFASLSLSGTPAAGGVGFHLVWSLSDAGTAARIRYFSGLSLLAEVTHVGAFSLTEDLIIPGDPSSIYAEGLVLATSIPGHPAVPEPASVSLAVIGLGMGLLVARRRR